MKLRSLVGAAALIASLFLVSLWVRSWRSSNEELLRARSLWETKDYVEAYRAYRSAIGWDAPFLGTSKVAYTEAMSRLESVPEEQRLTALWHIRAGLFSSRSLAWNIGLHAYPAFLEEVEAKIEKLSNPESKPQIQELYKPKADRRFQLLSNLFFWGWLLSVFGLIKFGFRADGAFVGTQAWRYVGAVLSFYFLWLCALLRA